MRAGYDRVYADTRKPLVPDLPLQAEPRADLHNDSGASKWAFVRMTTIFLSLLVIGMGTAALFAPSKTEPTLSAVGSDMASRLFGNDNR
jgi:hypothetical protein